MDISHPHDSFFRYMISKIDRAIDFAHHLIPSPIADHLLFDTMTSEQDTFIDSKLKNRYSDALFKVQTVSGVPSYAYLLVDHKSSPEAGVIFQLQRYINRFWERHILNYHESSLPPIVGIVIYHGLSPWNIETDLKNKLDCHEDIFPYMPIFRYLLIDLSTITDDQFRGEADLRAALLLMKYIFHPNLHEYVPMILRVLKEARHQHDFMDFFEAFLLYLFNSLTKDTHREIEKTVHIEFPIEGEQVMPTIADMYREQGREEGLVKGITKLLRSKFDNLPLPLEERIHSVHDLSALETIMDIAIESETLDEFQQKMESFFIR